MNHEQLLKIVLRIGGVLTSSAFVAMLLPVEWMAATHARLGLGEFPRTAIVDYLARSVSAFYGFHGVLLFVIATDPVRFKPIVTYVAVMTITLGVMLLAFDLHAGLPMWWTAVEGPYVFAVGVLIAWLNRQVRGAVSR